MHLALLWCACADPRAAPYDSHHSFCTFTCSDIIYGLSDEAFSIDIFRNSHCARRDDHRHGITSPNRSSIICIVPLLFSVLTPLLLYCLLEPRSASEASRVQILKCGSHLFPFLSKLLLVSVCIGSNVGVSEGRTNMLTVSEYIQLRWSVESVFTNVATRSR